MSMAGLVMGQRLQAPMLDPVYRRGRAVLVLAIVALNVYTIATPFLPALTFRRPSQEAFEMPADVPPAPPRNAAPVDAPVTPGPAVPGRDPNANYLYIPSIGLEQAIYEGSSARTLNKGVWHRPYSSNPEQGSNTVVAGHRFSYKHPSVFYHLDKVKLGDRLFVDWKGRRYTYEVTETKVVSPHDVYIEDLTEKEILTVYTCTPLWTAKDRLVVVAERVEVTP